MSLTEFAPSLEISSAQIFLVSSSPSCFGKNPVRILYYLPRVDRIFLDRNGVFQVKRGAPSDNPVSPKGIDGAMNIADCYVPAYTFQAKQVRTTFINHKRYQMTDISKLEPKNQKS